MNYRRARVAGGTYFFTVVTFKRQPILCESGSVENIKNAFRHVMEKRPFAVDAMVLLPDHLHCMWTMPDDDRDFSTRWRLIKTRFTRQYAGNMKFAQSQARAKKKEQTVWQRRFWEHLIRDDDDYKRHVEYILTTR